MGGGWRAGRAGLAAVVVAGALVLAPAEGRAAPAPEVPVYDGGFRIEGRTSYRLDPAAGAVHVVLDLSLTNQKPNQVVGSYIRQYYLPDFRVPVLAEAVGLRAVKSDGTTLPVSVTGTESPRFSIATIDLRPDLYHPNTQRVQLTYDLPKQAPRADRFTRINEAYATFPMLAIGDPGLADVEVLVPAGFDVELVGDPMVESEREGHQVFTAAAVADPFTWEVQVAARDDSKLLERTVDLGDQEVRVLGWPDDPEWADFAETHVSDGVPVLEDLIGLAWPADQTLDVVETSSPYLYGYAGWYQPWSELIEVGDELDAHVMLHELAHLWFNDDLFAGRWINEALAEVFAAAAVDEMGGEARQPEPVRADDPGRLRLNQWGDPDLQSGDTDAQEDYGYNTSWSALQGIVDEIGMDGIAAVVQAADEQRLPYEAETVESVLTQSADWRSLLDYLEEVGGSTAADGVFRELVVAEADLAELDQRATARAAYAELEAVGEGWAPPAEVRREMSDWDFETATELFPEVERLLGERDELEALVATVDLEVPAALRESFEGARDVDDLAVLFDEAAESGAAVRTAQESHDDGAGPLGAIGLLGSGVDGDLAAARAAFAAGDYERAAARSADVEDRLDGAVTAGLLRVGGAVLALFGLGLLVRFVRRRRARARATGEGAPPPAEQAALVGAGLARVSETDGAEGVGGPADDGGQLGV